MLVFLFNESDKYEIYLLCRLMVEAKASVNAVGYLNKVGSTQKKDVFIFKLLRH